MNLRLLFLFTVLSTSGFSQNVWETVDIGGGDIRWYRTSADPDIEENPPSILDAGDSAIVHHSMATCGTPILNNLATLQGNCVEYSPTYLDGTLIVKSGGSLYSPSAVIVRSTGSFIVESGAVYQFSSSLSNNSGYVRHDGMIRYDGSLINQLGGTFEGSGFYECRGSLRNVSPHYGTAFDDNSCFHGVCNDSIFNCNSDIILPLRLVSFQLIDNQNSLFWETEADDSHATFFLENSMDGVHWEAIGTVEGKNARQNNYYFDIPEENKGTYFRFKYEELDGAFEYSPIISRVVDQHIDLKISEEYLEINLDKEYQLKLFSSQGTIIHQTTHNSGKTLIPLNNKGLIILTIQTQETIYQKRLFINP